MKYKISSQLFPKGRIDAWELGCINTKMLRAIWALLEAGDICLTEDGYNRLDESLKSLFIGVK